MRLIPLLLISFVAIHGYGQRFTSPLLQTLTKEIQSERYPKIDAILIQVGDQLLMEEYFHGFGPDSLHDTRSSFKSITSLLTGIAIDQGLISLTDSLQQFFPELKGQLIGTISLRDLLEMKSGLDCEEFYGIGPDCETPMWETKDWIAFCLNIDMKDEPGLNWAYTSIEPMLVGEVISRASGRTIMDFAKQYLFQPLGIQNYRWTLSPKGRGMTAGSFFMRPRDMLKIAQLVQQTGKWEEKQIVSSAWIEKSTSCTIDIDFSFVRYSRMHNAQYESARYGYYWYREMLRYGDIETEVLFASGNGGQYMMYLEEYEAVVVFTGSNYGNWRGKLPFEMLLKYVIPMVEGGKGK